MSLPRLGLFQVSVSKMQARLMGRSGQWGGGAGEHLTTIQACIVLGSGLTVGRALAERGRKLPGQRTFKPEAQLSGGLSAGGKERETLTGPLCRLPGFSSTTLRMHICSAWDSKILAFILVLKILQSDYLPWHPVPSLHGK